MTRLLPRQRAAAAIAIIFTVATMGAALATPEIAPDGNPNRTLDISPNDGDNLPSPATVTVTGVGFTAGVSGNLFQCTFDATAGFDVCSNALARFTAAGGGGFTQPVQVTSTFTGLDSAGNPVQVNCLVVACFVQAVSDNGQNISQHHISFSGAGTTSTSSTSTTSTSTTSTTSTTVPPTSTTSTSTTSTTSTTVPPTSTTSTSTTSTTSTTVPPTSTTVPPTSTTVPPTSTTVPPTSSTVPPTSTTVPPTSTTSSTVSSTTSSSVVGGTSRCALLQAARAAFNAQIDQLITVINANVPASQRGPFLTQLAAARAQGNAQLDAALAQSNCSTAT